MAQRKKLSPRQRPAEHSSLRYAYEHCQAKGGRMTPLRARALEILHETQSAVSAYQLLERFRMDGLATAPTAAYRALDFLCRYGLAHRIESLNAYIPCQHINAKSAAIILICDHCKSVCETHSDTLSSGIEDLANSVEFQISHSSTEIFGRCQDCKEIS